VREIIFIFTAKYTVIMQRIYIWQQNDWANFKWDDKEISYHLGKVRAIQGRLIGKMSLLGFDLKSAAELDTLTMEVTKSSEIEGEILDSEQVRSSIARHLGIDNSGLPQADRYIDGVVEVMIDATQNYLQPLTQERLFGWHAALFPTGRSGMHRITVGDWRKDEGGAMQVVSGAMGKEKVHYQAPDANDVPQEMENFLSWLNCEDRTDPALRAAIAHLWFVTIHPFDDGNGRLARTIADMLLTRADCIPQRFYSMSAQIRKERTQYYEVLEKTQKSNLDITDWLIWFLDCLEAALLDSENSLSRILQKSKFWERNRKISMNDRQTKIINMLWDGFDGKLTTSKWAKITKTSPDTALRDIQDLVNKGVLRKTDEGGRSTNYEIIEE